MLTIEDSNGVTLAYLNNLEEAKVHEILNGEYTISFIATIDHLKTDYLYNNNNLINYEDDLFRVVTLEELHDEDNMLTVAITAEHISYDLINNTFYTFSYSNKSAAEVMSNCLLGTGFILRHCDIAIKTDIDYQTECNSKQLSIAIASDWRGELKYFRNYIDLVQERGENRGIDFRFGKNLKSIKRIRNFAEDTTSYDVTVQQGAELEELGHFELGDTIRVIDDRLNCDYECRIVEIEKDILTGLNSKVILGSLIKDLRSSFSKVKETVEEVAEIIENNSADWNKIKDITDNLGNVVADKIVGGLSLAVANILNSAGTFKQTDNALYWQNQPKKEDSTFASMWNNNGIMFARSKNGNGEWIWESALNAEGLIATQISASAINALTVQAIEVLCTKLTAQTIQGLTIEGATIYSGDRKAGNYIEITPNNPIKVYRNNILVSSLGYSDVGGGNLTIYDIGGEKAFHVECLNNGNLQLYANSDSGFIDDPDHPGFAIPNPNPRYMQVDAGRVVFPNWSAGEYNNDKTKFFRFVTEFDLKQFDSRLDSLQRQLDNKANQWHRHSCSSTNGHTHSIS